MREDLLDQRVVAELAGRFVTARTWHLVLQKGADLLTRQLAIIVRVDLVEYLRQEVRHSFGHFVWHLFGEFVWQIVRVFGISFGIRLGNSVVI